MERIQVPWSETPPPPLLTPPQHAPHSPDGHQIQRNPWSATPPPPLPTPPHQHAPHSPDDHQIQRNTQQHCDSTAADTSPIHSRHSTPDGSPQLHPAPDPVQIAYSTAVESPSEAMTVIRGLKSMSPDHCGTGEQLVYQTIGDTNGYLGQYGVSYVGNSYSQAQTSSTGSTSPYSYIKSGYDANTIQMVQAYDHENPRSISPQGVILREYPISFQYQSQDASHPNALPMWGALGTNSGSGNYPGLGSPILDSSELGTNGRSSYSSYVNSPYLLTPTESSWSTLPSMSSSSYLQDGRRSQYSDPPPEYSRITEPVQHQCAMCGTTDSSPWRRDATGQFVCNACGIYKNGVSTRANAMRPQRRLTTSRRVGMTCSNCSTTDTTLWRRNTQGEPVCNACGLYYKLHQVNRPISMRKDSIQTRKRKPKSSGSVPKGNKSLTSVSSIVSSNGKPSRLSSSSSSYLPQLEGSSDLSDAPHHHRLVHSPILPSSATLSQQLPHFPPLDSPHETGELILENGIVLETSTPSVISVNSNKQL